MIKNIFLDAGGVILDERELEKNSARIITELIKGHNENYSLENYREDAEEAVYRFVPGVYNYILYKNAKDIAVFHDLKKQYKERMRSNITFELMEGITDFLKEFSQHYRIGILGQYGEDFKEFLDAKNVLPYFTYRETQAGYQITKPDPRYFEAILRQCNCAADESVMIGDRIDKDIIPAKMIGMKTIRVRTGLHKNQEARVPEEMADFTVDRLEEIKKQWRKLWN